MALTDIKQGEDIDIIVVIPDDDGDPQNLNDLYNVLVTVLHKKTNKVLEKFSLLTLTGYSTLLTYNAEDGEVEVIINDETTSDAKTGLYQLVAERISENSNFTDGYYNRKFWSDSFNLKPKEPTA